MVNFMPFCCFYRLLFCGHDCKFILMKTILRNVINLKRNVAEIEMNAFSGTILSYILFVKNLYHEKIITLDNLRIVKFCDYFAP